MKLNRDFVSPNYVALNSPHRMIGHEQIAGWRGKVDPGDQFDWNAYYEQNFNGHEQPSRKCICHPEIADSFGRFVEAVGKDSGVSDRVWHAVSHAMETSNRLLQMQWEN